MVPESRQLLQANLRRVRDQLHAACAAAGRSPDDVTLVAVTKYVDLDITAALVESGCVHLGESRPQQLWNKVESLPQRMNKTAAVQWHLIGHLQRNKAKRSVRYADWIHSVDSAELLADLERHAADADRQVKLLLEVNISGDTAKHGLAIDAVEPLLIEAASCRHAPVCGLMGMASLTGGRDQARRDFERLRTLRDRLLPRVPPGVSLAELSMGMSDDFDLAIASGATLIRVGSALFEGLLDS